MMNNMFIGKPPASIKAWIKEHRPPAFEGDIYVLDDGTEVKVSKDDPLAQGAVNIYSLPDGLANDNISTYKYGAGHGDIVNLYYDNRLHGIDLSKTKIESFDNLYLSYNQLTAFSLPASLTSFSSLDLIYNQLTAFSLLDSLVSFYSLWLDNTCNLDCTACTSVPTIYGDIYNQNGYTWQGTVLVRDPAQKVAFEADEMWKQYKIEVK